MYQSFRGSGRARRPAERRLDVGMDTPRPRLHAEQYLQTLLGTFIWIADDADNAGFRIRIGVRIVPLGYS
jgi:hypothetical protein